MKTILKAYTFSAIALFLGMTIVGTLDVGQGADGFLITSGALALLNMFGKPVLKIILLPINMITFGLFSWVSNVIILYVLDRFIPFVSLSPWEFPGISYHGVAIASFQLNMWQTYIATSLIIAIIGNFLHWLSSK